MSIAPSPEEIYRSAEREGERRLSMSLLDVVSTSFIAGVTIVFGIAALGVVEALAEPDVGSGIAKLLGALAFATGLVFLVVGRSELFSENFFDPVAAAVRDGGSSALRRLLRLWVLTLLLNVVGGAMLVGVLTVEGALPGAAPGALVELAEEIAARPAAATLARAVLAGALLALLSYMLQAVNSVRGRISVAFMVGFLVALGPFDHVVVTALHLLFGIWLGGTVGYGDLLQNMGLATVGNVLGGLLLITLTHTAQVMSERDDD